MTPLRVILCLIIAGCAIALVALMHERRTPALCDRCSVIVISAEALGMEDIGMLDPEGGDVPQLAALARKSGIFFERAYAQAPWSVPAHAALLTGFYPWDMGIWDGVDALPTTVETVAGRFKEAGYRTALFSNGFIAPAFGFGRGFEETNGAIAGVDDETLFEEASAWLSAASGTPSFAFVHTASIALPYGTEHPYSAASLIAAHEKPGGPTALDSARYREAYAESAALFDARLARFISRLDEQGLLASTTVVITAGNGERLSRPAELGLHAASLSDESLRVPLVFLVPHEAARRVEATVETRSLGATLLAIVGIRSDTSRMGASLVPLMQGTETEDRIVLASTAKDAANTLNGIKKTPGALEDIASGVPLVSARTTPYAGLYAAAALKGTFKVLEDATGTHRVVNVSFNKEESGDLLPGLQPRERALVSDLLVKLVSIHP